jgi:hypothetical protein
LSSFVCKPAAIEQLQTDFVLASDAGSGYLHRRQYLASANRQECREPEEVLKNKIISVKTGLLACCRHRLAQNYKNFLLKLPRTALRLIMRQPAKLYIVQVE